MRRVTVEFYVPEQAPVFRGDDGQYYSLIPLSVMRRKTLVNFEVRDDEDRPVAMPSLRQNQAITESLLLACADATTMGRGSQGAQSRQQIEDFVHRVVSGTQQELVAAYESLEKGHGPEPFASSLRSRIPLNFPQVNDGRNGPRCQSREVQLIVRPCRQSPSHFGPLG